MLALHASAHAQEEHAHATPPEAVEFFRIAREAYQDGRYQDAADNLERALILDPASPTLLFNLARVYELLGDLDRSLTQYQHYLQLLPADQTEERERAQAAIHRLEGARDSGVHQEPEQRPEPLRELRGTVEIHEPGVVDEVFWIVAGASAACLIAALITAPIALDRRGAGDAFVLGRDGSAADRQGLYDTATALGVVTDVGFVLAGAGAVSTLLLYFLRERVVERPIQAQALVAPGMGMLLVRGSF